jgi:hypothetical protein
MYFASSSTIAVTTTLTPDIVFEYTVDLSGKQIFPNDTLKQDIVTHYKASSYNISSLKYRILGFNISASDIKIDVKPSRIDETRDKS